MNAILVSILCLWHSFRKWGWFSAVIAWRFEERNTQYWIYAILSGNQKFRKILIRKKTFFKNFTKTENRKKAIFEAKNFWGSRGRREVLRHVFKRTFWDLSIPVLKTTFGSREPRKKKVNFLAKIANKGVVRSKFVEKSWAKIFGVPGVFGRI